MRDEKTLSLFRLCLSLLACSAIITQFIIRAQLKPFNPVNFFSFFTIESNILVVCILLLSSIGTATFGRSEQFSILRGASNGIHTYDRTHLFFAIKRIRRVTSNGNTMGKYSATLYHADCNAFRLDFKSTY